MKRIFLIIAFCLPSICLSQVGINTVSPSPASVLDVEASNNGSFGGFLLPRVTLLERNQIPVSSEDDGLLIFLQDANQRCLQVYDAIGATWRNVYCMPLPNSFVPVVQNFDDLQTWTYTTDTPFFDSGVDGFYGIADNLSPIDLDGNFLGVNDLDDEDDNGTTGFANIVFADVDVSGFTNIKIAFTFDVFEFDRDDDVRYELLLDGLSQGTTILVEGSANLSIDGTQIINIPNEVNTVSLIFSIRQNGIGDFAGFDDFMVFQQ